MTNPYLSGSSGIPDYSMSSSGPGSMPRRLSYATVVNGGSSSTQHRSGGFSHLLNQSLDDPDYDFDYRRGNSHRDNSRGQSQDMSRNGRVQGGPADGWGGQLPSFSSAFGAFTNGRGSVNDGGEHADRFFVPSYLRCSRYVQRLEEAHRRKAAAERDDGSSQTSRLSPVPTSATTASAHVKGPSYRGVSYDLVEKEPNLKDNELPSMPTKWNTMDKHAGLEVSANGQEVKFIGQKQIGDTEREASSIRADHAMPVQCGVYYYEVNITSRKKDE